jgi:radical SAM protein with 4Fe4S-binding SPASM domain
MPFDDFLRSILPLKEAYPRDSITIAITGGEPLLRNDLFDCGRVLRENGFRWGIVTNGYAYTAEVHGRLLGAGMGSVTVSLDGLEDTHNWLRGGGNSFDRAVNAVRLIAGTGRLSYDVVTCVNRKNIDQLDAIKKLLIGLKVKTWRLFTIDPIGRAAKTDAMQLTTLEIKQLLCFIEQAAGGAIEVRFDCEGYTGFRKNTAGDDCFFCRAGITIASVLIDGSISACPNINRHFVQGNIYNDNFLDVWNNRFEIMRDRGWTKTGVCLDCAAYNKCLGGPMHSWNEKRDTIMTCLAQ